MLFMVFIFIQTLIIRDKIPVFLRISRELHVYTFRIKDTATAKNQDTGSKGEGNNKQKRDIIQF